MPTPFRLLHRCLCPSALAFLSSVFVHGETAVPSPLPTSLRSTVDALVRPLMKEHDLPGLAVGLYHDGRREFFYYGVTSRDTGEAIDGNTLFEVGSVSKTFNATLACYAHALGALSLEDHPGRYLPELKDAPVNRATLLNLGTCTAGDFPLQFPETVNNDQAMVAYFSAWTTAAAPGTVRSYSNPSIGLLGRITALSLKTDYASAIEKRLLPDLGLHHTYIHVPDTELASYAWGHSETSNRIRVKPGVLGDEAYGIKTTAPDLLRFLELNIAPSALEGPWQYAVLATQVPRYEVPPLRQGLGWEQYPWPVPVEALVDGNSPRLSFAPNPALALKDTAPPTAPTLFNKTGSTNGFGAYALFVPQLRIGLVLLANKYYPNSARVRFAHAVLETLSPPPASP